MRKGKPTQFRSDKFVYCRCMPSIFDCIGLVQSQDSIIHFRQLAKQLQEMRDRDFFIACIEETISASLHDLSQRSLLLITHG